jgi:uncharacterized protein YuzE
VKIDYDAKRDLLYVNLAPEDTKSHRTETIAPGVLVDFDRDGKVIGIEFLEASTVIGANPRLEVALRPAS